MKNDVLVIGGGAAGVASAYYLARSGFSVTLVEKDQVCSGCSYGNAGLLVPSHSVPLAAPGVVSQALKWIGRSDSPFYIRPRVNVQLLRWLWRFYRSSNRRHVQRSLPLLRDLSFASLELYDELDSIEGFDFDLRRNGYLHAAKKTPSKDGDVKLLNEAGVTAEVLTREEAQELVPETELDIGGAIHFPQDWNLSPYAFVTGLAEQASQLGVEILTDTEVLGFEQSGNQVSMVRTTRGDFFPREVVLAAGSWSPVVVKDLALDLPIQAGKGYSITFKRPPNAPSIPISLGEARVGLSTMGDTLRFAGTLELSGLTLEIDQVRVQAILKAVPSYLPELHPDKLEMIEIWRGMRPCTPDGLPLLGRVSRFKNLTVASGHAMIGISLSPITGMLVSEIISGQTSSIDLSLTNPDRFV
tara:strand:- start:676 stop:1917 length:1242 start_codon:yes stop_codon:yes gene_type:complete